MKRLLLALALVPLMCGCALIPLIKHDDPTPVPTTSPSPFTIALGDGVTLAVVGEDSSWATTDQYRCADTMHQLTTATGDYRVTLLRSDCTSAPQALNGFHGYFAAPPAGAKVSTATTPIGSAQLFSNEYEECTNSCGFATDEVALVPVGDRTVQVIAAAQVGGSDHTRDRTQLVSLLQGLRKA
jgi:hypothetical protein